jgi:hypothetical protein
LCCTLQRHFAYEHPDLLDHAEDEYKTSTVTTEDNGSIGPDSFVSESTRKKQKCGHTGRTAKDKDFWSKVKMWFEARQKQ